MNESIYTVLKSSNSVKRCMQGYVLLKLFPLGNKKISHCIRRLQRIKLGYQAIDRHCPCNKSLVAKLPQKKRKNQARGQFTPAISQSQFGEPEPINYLASCLSQNFPNSSPATRANPRLSASLFRSVTFSSLVTHLLRRNGEG